MLCYYVLTTSCFGHSCGYRQGGQNKNTITTVSELICSYKSYIFG